MPFIATLYALAFCRVVIGIVFLVSSVTKSLDIIQFKQTINAFHILPPKLCSAVAILFLCGEFAVPLLVLIGGPFLLAGFSLAIILLLLFSLALVSVLARKIRTSCNCFGASTKQVSSFDVWRNVGFMLWACSGWTLAILIGDAQKGPGLPGWIVTGLGATIFVIIWTQLGEIAQLFRRS